MRLSSALSSSLPRCCSASASLPASLCLVAVTALAPVSSAAAVAPCVAGDDGSFPLGTRIHGGPDTYRAGGAPGTWYIDLVNAGAQACAGVHPVVVLVDDERLLRPSQAKLDFYDGRKRRPVRLESTDHQELVGVVGADGFAGYTVAPGKTVTVRLRLMITSEAYADHVTAKAALVQRRGQDGEWVGESEDYVFDIDGEEPDPARTKGSAPPTRPPGPTATDEAGRPVGTDEPARPTKTDEAGRPVGADEAGRPAGTEDPARPVGTDEPARPQDTDESGRPVGTEEPGRAEDTEAPGRAGNAEEPGRPLNTDDPGRPVSTDEPAHPADPDETPDPTDPDDPDSTPVSPSRAPDTTEAGVTPAPEDPYAPDTPAPAAPSPSTSYDTENPDDPQLPELAHTGSPLPRALLAAVAALLILLGTAALTLTRKRR
ncbi:hypothetical protein E5083_29810 [Streptomyces bauhiniae]|uniref:Gram-positive cocci surface proteins LPxTG domain-containing protein n=1 Tax=Streptomyces bauhiniae TaxID=2340725 RepID=A0A4Z1CUJ8_9ACTN|nr:hypothetical protein [Streptomyces bauhiniae]TGN72459.1 hypothetical protein E5083_29810 [Streptomyces bauhiniae]